MSASSTSARIDDAAADWAARLDRAPLAPEEAAVLDAWLAEDVRHQGAFARARAVLTYFDRAKALGSDFDAEAFAAAPPARPAPTRRMVWASAAAVVATAGGALALYNGQAGGVRTRRGELRRVPLPDGSMVTLNTASRLVVDFKDDSRGVRLAQGEALFSVLRDAKRPFLVEAGDLTVRASEARFSIRRRPDREVEVVVCEGVVDVLRGGGKVQRISADTIVFAGPAAPVRTKAVSTDEVNRRLAWREGMIAFHGETLAEAAAEFARYADERIVIEDPEVAQRTVVGLFVANDPANFARAVASSFGLEAQTIPGGVRLTDRAPV